MSETLTTLIGPVEPWMIAAIIAGALIIIFGIGTIWATGRKAWGLLMLASGGGLSFTPALVPSLWNRLIGLGPLAAYDLPTIPAGQTPIPWPVFGVIVIAAALSVWLLTVLGRAVFDMRVAPTERRRSIRRTKREYETAPGDFDTLTESDPYTADSRHRQPRH